ncbi:hypothetical protein COY23_04505 [bacterium (Candidatus Torokbacteria) CG_4_10_14_0_2_um_filter_35_8]|nr:MAG: hypothetical protein COY23_04505 [bacterium (Candidatus Torokbacteria) CG_4_10_14_0_2_um_filter_35_8]
MYIDNSEYSETKTLRENNISTTIEIVKIDNGYIYKMTKRNVSSDDKILLQEKENSKEKVYYSKELIDVDKIEDTSEDISEDTSEKDDDIKNKILKKIKGSMFDNIFNK